MRIRNGCTRGGRERGEFRDKGQVIRCNKGGLAAMDPHPVETQVSVKVNVVQPEDRKHAGKGANPTRLQVVVSALEMSIEHPGWQSPRPLVEIAENDSVAGKLFCRK